MFIGSINQSISPDGLLDKKTEYLNSSVAFSHSVWTHSTVLDSEDETFVSTSARLSVTQTFHFLNLFSADLCSV